MVYLLCFLEANQLFQVTKVTVNKLSFAHIIHRRQRLACSSTSVETSRFVRDMISPVFCDCLLSDCSESSVKPAMKCPLAKLITTASFSWLSMQKWKLVLLLGSQRQIRRLLMMRPLHSFQIDSLRNCLQVGWPSCDLIYKEILCCCIWHSEKCQIRQAKPFKLACFFLKRHIEEGLNMSNDQPPKLTIEMARDQQNDDLFMGLGSKYEQEGFSEKCGYRWYENRYNLAQLSLYDQLAVCLLIEGCSKQDTDWYDKIIQKDPSNYKAIFGRGHYYPKPASQKFILQQNPFQKIIELKPEFDKPYEIIAFQLLENNVLDFAYKFAIECLKRNPNNIFAEYIAAVSNVDLSSLELEYQLTRIILKKPTYIRALHSYGKLLMNMRRYKEALFWFDDCVSKNEHYLPPYIDKAVTLVIISENQSAIKVLQSLESRIISQNILCNHLITCYYYLGVAYEKIGQLSIAVELYKNAHPNHNITKEMLGNIYFDLKNWRNAIAEYHHFIDKQCSLNIIQKAAECCANLKQYRSQIHWLHRWHLMEPSNARVHVKLAECYLKDECFEGCISWCMRCIAKDENTHFTYPLLIQALYRSDDCRQSLKCAEEYRQKHTLQPKQREWLLAKQMSNYYRMKQMAQAQKRW